MYSTIDIKSLMEINISKDFQNTNRQYLYLPDVKDQENLIGIEDPIPQENIGDLILNAFKSRPNFLGQMDEKTGEILTFQQMRENSVKCALWLKKVGIKKGDVVTICTRNSSAAYAPFLASIYIGAIVNPWEEKYFEDIIRVMYFLVINKPDVIFVDHDHFVELLLAITILKNIKKVIKIVTIGEMKCSIKPNSLETTILNDDFDKTEIDEFSCEENNIMDTAIRTFSFTARHYPSQVDIPYIAFLSPSNRETPVMCPNDIGLWYESLCWTHGPLLTVHAIISHVTAIKPMEFSEENLYKTIKKYKVTWVFLEGNACNQLFQTDAFSSYGVSSLKTLLFDNWETKQNIHELLVTQMTDVSIIRVYSKPETGVIAYQCNDLEFSSAGYVAKNVQLAFIGDNVERMGPNIFSWVFCKTPYIRGFHEYDVVKPWYSTKDKGFYDQKGKVIIINEGYRRFIQYKNTIIVPKALEDLLCSHPAVSEAVITAVRRADTQYPVAYIKKKPGHKVTEEELMAYVEKLAPDNCKLRGGVCFINENEIPRLPNGKIYREPFWRQTYFTKISKKVHTCT